MRATANGATMDRAEPVVLLKRPVTARGQAGKTVEQKPSAGASALHNAQLLVYLGAFRPT
jgi:hypothetical protein